MFIRDYTPADRAACLAIFNSNVPRFFAQLEETDFAAWLTSRDLDQHPDSDHYYVVEQDGQILACGGFYLSPNEQRTSMVWGMVHNTFHRQGIGRMFLQYRIGQIRLRRPDAVILLDTTQHSYPFFEKVGFTVTNVSKDYYAPGLDRYDMVG